MNRASTAPRYSSYFLTPYWCKAWGKWGKWGCPIRKRRGFPPKGAHCLSSLKLSQVVLYPFPCWCLQHFSYCSPSARFSRESGSEFWQSQLWPEGPASLVLAPGASASHLIGDLGSSLLHSVFLRIWSTDWQTGSISIAAAIHSSFLWNFTLYLLPQVQCFFRNSISESQRHLGLFLASCHWSSKLGFRMKTQDWKFCLFITACTDLLS